MVSAAEAAGKAAMSFFRPGNQTLAKVTMKSGNSPVTEADYAANAILRDRLRTESPEYGWVSEEDEDSGDRLHRERLFIVDPIDGTRAFIAGKPEWCVSIGLIEKGRPVAGVIHLPALGLTYRAAIGNGAFLGDRKLVCSRRQELHGSRYAGPKTVFDQLNAYCSQTLHFAPRVPSLAYRLAQAASGEVDIALASTGAHDWDIAAADMILHEAGAALLGTDGLPLEYNRGSLARDILLAGFPPLLEMALQHPGLHSRQSEART